MKRKNIRYLALMLAVVFVMITCISCDSGNKSMRTEASGSYDFMNEEATEYKMEDAVVEMEAEAPEEAGAGVHADELENPNRKLIKRYYLSLETREFDELVSYIQESVAAAGGYIENSNLSGTSIDGNGSRNAYFVLRVPVSDATSFVAGLEENGHLTNKSEEVEDVTLAYVDTQSRIEALRIEQETLMEMLKEAESLDTILGIQSRLTEVRYQLESYESQIRSYDNLIEYTTISVDVYEVKRETSINDGSFAERMKDNLSDNIYELWQRAQNLVISIVGALPYLLILIVVLVILFVIVKRFLKRKFGKGTTTYDSEKESSEIKDSALSEEEKEGAEGNTGEKEE